MQREAEQYADNQTKQNLSRPTLCRVTVGISQHGDQRPKNDNISQ
ncbi:MAG: hypothetical protein ACR5LF_14705 [Symbiopectobacterium sp.]